MEKPDRVYVGKSMVDKLNNNSDLYTKNPHVIN